ncbi:MAG TPA: PilZ domain-containing protein [Bryobacteraceae bacterium]|nr:PilZ domain-containing protein [Bryobacteraceae bacterium]
MRKNVLNQDRRSKHRFAIQRALHFRVMEHERVISTGAGRTVDISSVGVAFEAEGKFRTGSLVQLSISWPVLLDDTCLMQLMIVGRVVRTSKQNIACTIDHYEFRTQARVSPNPTRVDQTIRRWIENTDKDDLAFAAEI